MGKLLIVIIGGARAGKSAFAQALAAKLGERVTYVATAEAGDAEMAARIQNHRASRPAQWRTLETPTSAAEAVRTAARESEAVILDCLSLLTSNLLLESGEEGDAAEKRVEREISDLLAAHAAGTASLIIVTNEVGMGVVPAYPLGRTYRDLLGRANARLTRAADRVFLMTAGLAMEIKASGMARPWEDVDVTA